MVSELRRWWRLLRTAILFVGILLSFMAFVEVLHAYVILRDTYSPLGYAFLLLTTTGFICFLIYIFLNIKRIPRALRPPDIENLTNASSGKLHVYSEYLISYLRRLIKNPNLAPNEVNLASQAMRQLEQVLQSSGNSSRLLEEIDKVEKMGIEPILSKLDEMADAEVRRCVQDIMLGVTLSPFRSTDLIIVIYRNAAMVKRAMAIYYSRPILAEQIAIFRDLLKLVATVNYLNFGQKLMEQLFSRIPYVGPVLDDFAEGIGAGLFTSIAGHGTMVRCRAYKGWNEEIAIAEMSHQIKLYMKDVKNIFTKDVLPKMRNKVYSTASADEIADPGFWERTQKLILSAIDDTGTTVDSFIRKHASAASKGTVKAGSNAISKSRSVVVQGTGLLSRGAKSAGSKVSATSGSTWKAIRRVFRRRR